MSSSNLPEDLADIVSDYTDLKTLEILNKIDPKIYTSDKLFVKKLDGADRAIILTLAKINKDINIFLRYVLNSDCDIKKYRIDPFFMTCVMTRYLFDYDDAYNYTKSNEFMFEVIYERVNNIRENITSKWRDIFKDILKKSDKNIYFKFKQFQADMELDKKYICQILHKAYSNMLEKTNIYHTTGIDWLIRELIPYVHEIID